MQQLALGAPLLLAGAVKGGYDVALWRWARGEGIEPRPAPATGAATAEGGMG